MKKVISLVLVFVMVFSVCVNNSNFTVKAQEEKEKSTPTLDTYSVDKELIKSGDNVDIKFNIVDENIKNDIEIENGYLKMCDDSAFSYQAANNPFTENKAKYNKDKGGIEISFELKDTTYSVGSKLKVEYGFDLNGKKYKNSISFDIEETMRKVSKSEGEIKGYDLIAEDIKNNQTPKLGEIEDRGEEEKEQATNDEKVKEAQQWLNNRYRGKHGYTEIEEDGKPGTKVALAFVTGLQIDLGIKEPTGTFGEATKAAFDSQVGSLSKGSTDSGDKQYVTMLQNAMYCKGYEPGGVTGSFSDATAGGILLMKGHAGFSGVGEEVNSMWMKAVLNSDAYILVNKGNATVRAIQQSLNRSYYDYTGIRPCDGHYSRETNSAIIYAWQKEEGISVSEATGTFGPKTKTLCPNLPIDGRYSADKLEKFIILLKYSIYFNEINGREILTFNGKYDNVTINLVQIFQNFMVLPTTSGMADVGTILSFMTSKGDPDRSAKGCDCATKLDAAKVSALYNAGYRYVGRYLTNVPGGRDKRMELNEFRTISEGGLRVFPIFQQGNEEKEHFSESQGEIDAKLAVEAAKSIYVGQYATIYFAVDYDFMDSEVTNQVIPYFKGVKKIIDKEYSGEYNIGVYGSRNICTRVSNVGYAKSSFVSDMSTGYSGNFGYPMPKNWAFDQFNEYEFSGFGLDKDAVSGRDNGISLNTRYTGYNRSAAREYANQWYNGKNTDCYYYYNRGDCANFVSQCLVAGGIPMNDAWYSYKYDNRLEIEENPENTTFDIGEPWRLAKQEYEYFKNIDCGYRNGEIIKITNREEVSSTLAKCAAEGNPIQMGDLMYFSKKNKGEEGVHHATMISYADLNCIKYTAHSSSRFDEDITNEDFLDTEDMYIIRIHNNN